MVLKMLSTKRVSKSYIGCLNIHGAHITVNNSANNNVMFFFYFCFRFKNSILYQLLILEHNALDKKGKIFGMTTYLEDKNHSKLPQNRCKLSI